VNVIVDEQVSS